MQGKLIGLFIAAILGVSSSLAVAKLPPLTEEQKAKAEEANAKQVEAAKKGADALAGVQDAVAERYLKSMTAKGADTKPMGSTLPPAAANAAAVPASGAPAAATNK